MGLRDKIRTRLKGLLGDAPRPATPPPATPAPARSAPVAATGPTATPPVVTPSPRPAEPSRPVAESPAPKAAEPVPSAPASPAPASPTPAATLVSVQAPASPPPATAPLTEPPPAEPATPPAAPEAVPLNADAPHRDAHLRPTFHTTARAVPVHVVNAALGIDLHFTVEPGEFVLEAADRAGFELPSSCRNGGCLTCTGKLLEGNAEITEDQYVLEPEHLAAGFRLLCCTQVYAPSTFCSHQEDEVT